MRPDENEESLLRSVTLQNARAILQARERVERELLAAMEALERKSAELAEQREFFRVTLSSIGEWRDYHRYTSQDHIYKSRRRADDWMEKR